MSQDEFDQTIKSGQYDNYPLTVEEYEVVDEVSADVEVE